MTDQQITKGFILLGIQVILLWITLCFNSYMDYRIVKDGLGQIIKEAR